jgi:hypothetical protein
VVQRRAILPDALGRAVKLIDEALAVLGAGD